MSFIKKHIKRVIKTVKKIVRSDIFKYIVIAAAIFFTAGVAAGGFAAFAGVNSIGGFFVAVGQTMATGASAIAGGLGFQSASTSLAGYGGAAAEAAGLTASSQILAPVAVNAVTVGTGAGQAASVAAAQAASAQAAGSGFLGAVKGVLGKQVLGDVTIGQLAANGITMGIKAKLDAKAKETDPVNGYVAGGLMRGGGSEAPGAIDYEFGSEEPAQATQQVEADPGQTLAGEMAYAEQAAPGSGIQQMIQDRGPLGEPGYGGVAESQRVAAAGGFADQGGLVPSYGMGIEPSGQQAPQGRVFTQGASQLQLQPRGGLV